MFWIASARPNTSRPQPFTCDIGVRKKPSVARGPKLIMEIRQPHNTMTSGVRQPIETLELEGNEIAMCPESVPTEFSSGRGFYEVARPSPTPSCAWQTGRFGLEIGRCRY